MPHDTKPHIPDRSPAPLIFRLGRGHLYSRYWARLRIGFCQLGSRSESLLRTRPCKSKISKSATEPLGGAARWVSMASTWSFLSRSRTRRIASRPTSSLSPHSNTGSPVTLASSNKLGEVGQGQALGTSGRGEGNQASGRQDRGVFLAFGQADRGGAGRINRIKPPKLPTVASDTGVAPLAGVAPMPTALAVSALVLD